MNDTGHQDDDKPTLEDIQNEIERLGLDIKSNKFLKDELARLSLENKLLLTRLYKSEMSHRSSVLDLLKLQHEGSSKFLDRGIVKTASTRLQSRGGKATNKVNEHALRRQEILDAAKRDIESGLLKHGGKEKWIENILKEERYKGQKFSIKNLKRDITFK